MEAYFDRNGFREEKLKYEFAQRAIIDIRNAYAELDNGEFTIDILQQVIHHDIDKLEKEYTAKQVALAGKSPLVKQAVASIAMDRFDRFRAVANSLTIEKQLALNSVDFKLINLEGEFNEEKIREKHTYEVKTERQKAFAQLVDRMIQDFEAMKEYIPEGVPIIGDNQIFYIEVDGSVHYNPAAIKLVE